MATAKGNEQTSNTHRTITLETPIQRGEETIKTVTIRKPGTGELRGLSLTAVLKLDVDSLITLIPRVSSPTLTKHDVSEMDLADTLNIGSEIGGFLLTKEQRETYLNE